MRDDQLQMIDEGLIAQLAPRIAILPYMMSCIVGLLIVACGILVLLRMRKKHQQAQVHLLPTPPLTPHCAKESVQAVVREYQAHQLTEEEAYRRLATLARGFASQHHAKNFTVATLEDLHLMDVHTVTPSILQLRQIIAGIYPLEFAQESHQDKSISVEEVADWVEKLMERWKS